MVVTIDKSFIFDSLGNVKGDLKQEELKWIIEAIQQDKIERDILLCFYLFYNRHVADTLFTRAALK